MFGFNPSSQSSLTNSSGRWIRFVRKNGDNSQTLLKISVENVKKLADDIKKEVILPISSVFSSLPKRQTETFKSHETYFENNHGFKQAELLVTPLKRVEHSSSLLYNFLSRNVNSPYMTSIRTFKTKRSQSVEANKSLFGRRTEENPSNASKASLDGLKDAKYSHSELEMMIQKVVKQNEENNASSSTYKKWFQNFGTVISVLTTIAIFGLIFVQMGGFRQSMINEITAEEVEICFDDVKGCDEAKKELEEIVEFLMNPEKFGKLGGKLPKGVLLDGPPGTGKTLLAKAVAGEAGVPFFHIAGPEFDEIFVGQGARRVRDLFRAAKRKAPCVVFIDEIDSVGGKRTSATDHRYANQTINQLLSELDGFKENEGVIVLGATNMKSQLDNALLRPGRFDTHVTVELPDVTGREELLKLYFGKVIISSDVNVSFWARKTIGFSGADIQNLVNTAAIRAATLNKDRVTEKDLDYALDKATIGVDMKSRKRTMADYKITAYHEAGHTLVAWYTKGADPVSKVTIVSKGRSGGHTAFLPKDDYEAHITRKQLLARMDVGMGGRAAEEIIFGKDGVTGGASSDLEGASALANGIVKRLAMSDKVGLATYNDQAIAQGLIGDSTKAILDEEVNLILKESYERAVNLLKSRRKELERLAQALLEYETLTASEIKEVIEGKPLKKKKASLQLANPIVDLNVARAQPVLS